MSQETTRMKCPYRKKVYHHPEEDTYCATHCAYDEEGFADCYGRECPLYKETLGMSDQIGAYGHCMRALKEVE